MATETGTDDASGADERRAGAIRGLLLAFVITPILLLQYVMGTTGPLSTDVAIVAVPVAAVLGVATFTLVHRVDLSHYGDLQVTVGLLVLVVVTTVGVWVVVPVDRTATFLFATLAFIWAGTLSGVVRHVVLPRVTTAGQ